MRRFGAQSLLAAAAFLLLTMPLPAQQAAPTDILVGVRAADRLAESWWSDRHNQILLHAQRHPDAPLLLIGDSITNNYDKAEPPDQNFLPTWQQFYAPRHALNLGFSGDTTANVIWRIDHGELEGLHPRAVVLLIGTNNTGYANQSAVQTEVGIDALVADLEQRLPSTHILLLGILPSDLSADKTKRDQDINRYLATDYSEDPRVTYLDIGSIFLKDGKLNTTIFCDPRLPRPGGALHPDTVGQRRMAEAIEPTLARIMGDAPALPLASMLGVNTAVLPVERLEMDSYDWYARHHAVLALHQTLHPDVVMIGDSITHFWGGVPYGNHGNGTESWQRLFAGMSVLNMGFGWDRTQNVLWRLRQGEFDALTPKYVVLNIGTNNLTYTANARANTPQEIVDGIAAICSEVKQRSPRTHIILMAIFPRGEAPSSPLRAPINETNELLAQRFRNDPSLSYLDIGARFLEPSGVLPRALMPDGTHPSEAGYALWADALMQAGIGKH